MSNSFTQAYPTFSAYVVVGGWDTGTLLFQDSFSTRLFTCKDEAAEYAKALVKGTDEYACIDGAKYDHAHIHTMGYDGRISPNCVVIKQENA